MRLSCPDCGANIRSADVDLRNLLAKCESCDSVFDFTQKAGRGALTEEAARPEVERPGSIRHHDTGRSLVLVSKWFSPALLFMAFFCIAWDSFLIAWYSMAIAGKAPWIFIVFPICHVAVGVALTYATLAGFINETRVEVTRESLVVTHGPIPWWGNQKIPVQQLDQLFTQEKRTQHKNSSSLTYEVGALTKDGRRLKLLEGLDSVEKALYIEQQVEQRLGIADRKVAGEVAR